jgi:hypothetical protein
MRKYGWALSLVLSAGCAAEPVSTQSPEPTVASTAEAVSSGSGAVCIGKDGFHPPSFSITDFQTILTSVLYFSTPANVPQLFTGEWTNWYAASTDTALAKLATMRGILEKYNLSDTYLPGGRPRAIDCTGKTAVRQIDGTCNDPVDSAMGSAGVRFGRNIPVLLPNPSSPIGYSPNPKVYPNPATLLSPNPRTVSRKLFTRHKFQGVPFLNMFAAAWIQFQVHDWFNHVQGTTASAFHVPLDGDDPLRFRYGISELVIPKSVPDTMSPLEQALLPPTYTNQTTHWWDGSQIYGSDPVTAASLRDKDRHGNLLATLTIGRDGLIPALPDGFEQAGLRVNWWLGVALMHNLFAAEHNSIVAMLRASHPEFDEQALYDHARMINAAQIAKIHTIEWTPAIIPNPTLGVAMNANWAGLKQFAAPGTDLSPLLAYVGTLPADQQSAIISAVMGVAGGTRDLHGVPFSLTEEFVSVYRMHPLLPNAINVYSARDGERIASLPTQDVRNAAARAAEQTFGTTNLLYSFGLDHPGGLVLGNYPRFMQQLALPYGVVDMGAIDVLRDRERGIPRYNDFREQLRLPRVASIEDLTSDPAMQAKLHDVYGSDTAAIDRVDTLVGTFAETTRPTCYGFGETLFQVFTLMATRRLQADRFYTDDFRAEIYTKEGMDWIAASTFKNVLIRQHPELAKTALASVPNAFYPWADVPAGDGDGDADDRDFGPTADP